MLQLATSRLFRVLHFLHLALLLSLIFFRRCSLQGGCQSVYYQPLACSPEAPLV